MKNINYFLLCIILLFSMTTTYAGQVEGYVYDGYSNEPLPGVNVRIGDSLGTGTDINGRFVIDNVPPGTWTVRTQYIGFYDDSASVRIDLDEQTVSCKLLLQCGPVFSDSKMYAEYHQALQEAYAANPELVRLEIVKHQVKGNTLWFRAKIINKSDQEIYVPKTNYDAISTYQCELLNGNGQPFHHNALLDGSEWGKNYFDPQDLQTIKPGKSYTLPDLPAEHYTLDLLPKGKLYFQVHYTFTIDKPVDTAIQYPNFPPDSLVNEMEKTYTRILRLPLKSGIKSFKNK